MTRKDYILIAEALREEYEESRKSHLSRSEQFRAGMITAMERVLMSVADKLESDNPRFDAVHFRAVVRGEKDLNSHPARQDKDRTPGQGSPHCYDFQQTFKDDPRNTEYENWTEQNDPLYGQGSEDKREI
jgi:hypothetical protein